MASTSPDFGELTSVARQTHGPATTSLGGLASLQASAASTTVSIGVDGPSNNTQLTSTKEYIISGCTVADGDALAANNLPAFWADPSFRLNWPNRTLEYHVIQIAKRYPNNLLTGRETKRHLKAVHPDTGRIVGYVRWTLPAGFDASVWPEAVTPAVSEDDEAFFRRLISMADWSTGDTADEPIGPVQKAENEILSKKTYIRK